MDINELTQMLRDNPNLTDDLRADLFDLHAGNVGSINHYVLKAIATMAQMDPEQLEMAESRPHVLKAFVEQHRDGGGK